MYRLSGWGRSILFLGVSCSLLAAGMPEQAGAASLRPEVVQRLHAEGRLDQAVRMEARAHTLGINQPTPSASYRVRPDGSRIVADRQVVVILVDFSDNQADQGTYPQAHFESMLFSVNQYPTGSMRDYYLENSYGQFDVTGVVTVWLRLPQTYAYYVDGQYGEGDYPHNSQKMVEDALVLADPLVDFSQFDNDGPDGVPDSGDDDGFVDALTIIHAGPGAEETGDPNDLWSFAWGMHQPQYLDGVYAYLFNQDPENGRIGVFSHEFGHILGLPDLYDTDYSSSGVGDWCLMAGGSWGGDGETPAHLSAWCKQFLGFVTPQVVSVNTHGATIPEVEISPSIFRLWTNGQQGQQYFLVENRQQTMFDSSLPGSGLLIFHVDDSIASNDDENHPHVWVEQADGWDDLYYGYPGDDGDPWPGSYVARDFNDASYPNSRDYAGNPTNVYVQNISNPGPVMTADFGVQGVAGVDDRGPVADRLTLASPAPNPSSGSVAIQLVQPSGASAQLTVVDAAGRRVGEWNWPSAAHAAPRQVTWSGRAADGRELPAGVYFMELRSGDRAVRATLTRVR